jgi:hypothetical protein
MDDAAEAQAYSSASAEAYLSKIDDSFVEHAIGLIGPAPGHAIDIGCGPGQILKKLSAATGLEILWRRPIFRHDPTRNGIGW